MPCGIAGFVGLSDRQLLAKMLDVARHRGPDSTGCYVDTGIGLGTNRLSIIDLEKGNQPIHNEDESAWITFNGEIYNFVELRGELEESGHRFYTASDTETIVHAYENWGYDCLAHLRGMFAFAIWDKKKKILFAARDRFGKKPFYYTLKGQVLLFASELKSILEYDEIARRVDFQALDYFMTYAYVPSPRTAFQGIRKLPPGHYMLYDGRDVQVREYWDIAFNPQQTGEAAAVEKLYELIAESVRIRLRSDVPLGAFLSGGIDSSVVTALMSKLTDTPVKTVTVGFEEEDEHIRSGRMVAELFGTDHHEKYVTHSSIDEIPKLLWHFDEPFADASFIPTYYLSQMTREEVTVALTGDGGDEMFMGYPFLKDQKIFGVYNALPTSVRNAGLKILLKWPTNREFKKLAAHAIEKQYGDQDFFGRFALRTVVFTTATLRGLYTEENLKSRKVEPTLGYVEDLIAKCKSQDRLDAVDYATFKSYLSEMILTKVDRMSMAVSLESRCPLLDNVLAEYVFTLPSSLKWRSDTTKYILKKMALDKGLLPREIVHRKKAGFGPPVDKWLGGEWGSISMQLMEKAGKTRIFSPDYLSKLDSDRYVNASKIFRIAVFTLWHSQYIEQHASSPLELDKLLAS